MFATANTNIESAKKEAKRMLLDLLNVSRVNPKWTIEDYCSEVLKVIDRDFPKGIELTPEVQIAWSSTCYGILWTIRTARVWRVVEKEKGSQAVTTILEIFVRRLTGNDIGRFIDGRKFEYQGEYRGWVCCLSNQGSKTQSQESKESSGQLTSIYDTLSPQQQEEIENKLDAGWDDEWDDADTSSPTDSTPVTDSFVTNSILESPFSLYDFLSENEKSVIDARWETTRKKIEEAER